MEIAASDCLAAFEVQIHEDGVPPVSWEGDGTGARSPFPATVTMNREQIDHASTWKLTSKVARYGLSLTDTEIANSPSYLIYCEKLPTR